MPKISVIVPIYGVEQYIERCVISLFEQTFQDVEFIFVDDSSPDKSVMILNSVMSRYPNRASQVKIVHHGVNKGLTSARNSGLHMANGDYIIHTDSDDWMQPTMLEEMYDAAITNNADIVYCDFWFHYKNKMVLYNAPQWASNKEEFLKEYIVSPWNVVWNLLVKKSIYVDNRLSSLETICFCEDFNLSTKLFLCSENIVQIPKALHNYNQLNTTSIMHSFSSKHMQDEIRGCRDLIEYFKEKGKLNDYNQVLSHRLLKAKKEYALHEETFDLYIGIYPDSHEYIMSCPFLNQKLKCISWCLTHNLRFVSKLVVSLRKLLKR